MKTDYVSQSSTGEYSIADGGAADYEAYIDAIAAQVERTFSRLTKLPTYSPILKLTEYPNVRVVFVVEPDGLANLVTNLSVAKCANAQSTYEVRVHDCHS